MEEVCWDLPPWEPERSKWPACEIMAASENGNTIACEARDRRRGEPGAHTPSAASVARAHSAPAVCAVLLREGEARLQPIHRAGGDQRRPGRCARSASRPSSRRTTQDLFNLGYQSADDLQQQSPPRSATRSATWRPRSPTCSRRWATTSATSPTKREICDGVKLFHADDARHGAPRAAPARRARAPAARATGDPELRVRDPGRDLRRRGHGRSSRPSSSRSSGSSPIGGSHTKLGVFTHSNRPCPLAAHARRRRAQSAAAAADAGHAVRPLPAGGLGGPRGGARGDGEVVPRARAGRDHERRLDDRRLRARALRQPAPADQGLPRDARAQAGRHGGAHDRQQVHQSMARPPRRSPPAAPPPADAPSRRRARAGATPVPR